MGSDFPLAAPIDTFITVGNVEEKVLFMVLLIQLAHGGRGGWNDVVYKEEERILSSQVDSFPDEEVKLAHCQVGGDKVLLFIKVAYSCLGRFLHNYWHSVRVLLPDLLTLGAPLLERVLLFVLKLHRFKR